MVNSFSFCIHLFTQFYGFFDQVLNPINQASEGRSKNLSAFGS